LTNRTHLGNHADPARLPSSAGNADGGSVTPGPLTYIIAFATDRGLRRSDNEDSVAVETRDQNGHPCSLLVVADGMGGAKGGEVASRMAVDSVVQTFFDHPSDQPAESLLHAIESANHAIWERGRVTPDLNGMGTTCTAVTLRGGQLSFAHVGDSRAYVAHQGGIEQITSDHSLLAELVSQHQISAESARTDARRNVVTRSVGIGPQVRIDVGILEPPLDPGDTVLLCSDGLHGVVEDHEIAGIATSMAPADACRALVQLANERGGPDNITVIIARAAAGPGS
jgi:protein phosphatase